jgi:diaminohydroxyphosphoribosylaminopyrimidine deaminase / 5-amino-6-(5-phosphoribosylamino)uracil reductase
MEQDHTYWMERALALARKGAGLTRPNPPVGAVVVRKGQCVGEGYHRKAGGPHAEVHALKQAGRRAEGATLYVTLEPCSTTGRTPPCTDRILESGVTEVVVAVNDPNPIHAGRGLRLLRKRGVRVTTGICRAEAAELLLPFARWVRDGRPYVTLKLGITVDGKIADRQGHSRWITGPQARREVQALRRRADAVMVGAGTVIADNPSLWPRPANGRRPLRVIVDGKGRAPSSARVFTDEHADHTVWAVNKGMTAKRAQRHTAHGARTMTIPASRNSSAQALLKQLGGEGILHILCEGGGDLAESLIRAGCVDEYVFFVSPKIMGGRDSRNAVSGKGWLMTELPEVRFIEYKPVGKDIMIRARPRTG